MLLNALINPDFSPIIYLDLDDIVNLDEALFINRYHQRQFWQVFELVNWNEIIGSRRLNASALNWLTRRKCKIRHIRFDVSINDAAVRRYAHIP
jgi:hypothetical protein